MKFDLNDFKLRLNQKNFLSGIEYFEEIDSTNTYLKNLKAIDRKLVIADFQSAGRGRFNRRWISNKGENLTFSIGFENFPVSLISKLNFFVPVIISIVIEELYNLNVEIKWPNDLLINRKKICGILIENTIDNMDYSKVILGIGINCNQTFFPEEISSYASSLKLIYGKNIVREELLAKLIDAFANNLEKFFTQSGEFYHLYKKKCFAIGKKISVSFNREIFTGTFYDVSENGEMILLMDKEKFVFNSGEITTIKE